MTNNKTLVAGAGNPWRRDDGIGALIIKQLHELSTNSDQLYCSQTENQNAKSIFQNSVYLENIDLVDIGTDGLALLDILPKYHKAIIIDAVDMGSPPGTIRVFTPDEAKIKITNDALSTHGFGLAAMLKLAEQLGIDTKITIIGIQPKDVSFGNGLSLEVKKVINKIFRAVCEVVSSYAKT